MTGGASGRRRPRRAAPAALALLGLAAAAAGAGTAAADARVEDMSWGPVRVSMSVDPPDVRLDGDTRLTLRVTAPAEVEIVLPELAGRLEGFELKRAYDPEPVRKDSWTTWERHANLTPLVSARHGIRAMAIEYVDRSRTPAAKGWFPTRPLDLPLAPGFVAAPEDRLVSQLDPAWIPPPRQTLANAGLCAAAALLAALLVLRAARAARRFAAKRSRSPRDMARRELAALLRGGLPAGDRVRDFYLELTWIVRRYIERRHGVRAPEQTTQEFLQAARGDARFGQGVLGLLTEFLSAADLVKFAAVEPSPPAVREAVATARRCIDADWRGAGRMEEERQPG